ncbi:hypothetical protein HZC21_03650 [Candidatus Peregrinibacteria bacterium]|nr:hypothetical protein [Candidatus Peregrinibacteria bacterium]
MYKVAVVVEGTGRGLLMHRFSAEASAGIEKQVKKAREAKLTPQQEATLAEYRLDPGGDQPGQLFLPAEHFLGAMVGAGSDFKQQSRGKKTFKDAFKGSVEVVPDYVGLTDAAGEPLRTYVIDSRPVRIKATQGRIMRHRPFLQAGWRAKFMIEVMDDTIPLEVVQAVLETAGRSKCVGDYRPRFGQFRIVSFDRAKAE